MHRDSELRGRELPLLKLSWVQHQERRAAPVMLALLIICIASQFAAIWVIRPLMLRSPWYGFLLYACLLVLWTFMSFILLFGWVLSKVYRWFSLVCPYCRATLSVRVATMSGKLPADLERVRRCKSCRAVAIDPEV